MKEDKILVVTPEIAYRYTRENGPDENLEMIIATDAKYSFWYAKYVLRGKFELGERIIASNQYINRQYIDDVINYDFELADKIYQEALDKVNGRVDLL